MVLSYGKWIEFQACSKVGHVSYIMGGPIIGFRGDIDAHCVQNVFSFRNTMSGMQIQYTLLEGYSEWHTKAPERC